MASAADSALVFGLDGKTGVSSDYVMLNGSQVARVDGTPGGNTPAVPGAVTLGPTISRIRAVAGKAMRRPDACGKGYGWLLQGPSSTPA